MNQQACRECGVAQYRENFPPSNEKFYMDQHGVCFECAYWRVKTEADSQAVVVNGYLTSSEPARLVFDLALLSDGRWAWLKGQPTRAILPASNLNITRKIKLTRPAQRLMELVEPGPLSPGKWQKLHSKVVGFLESRKDKDAKVLFDNRPALRRSLLNQFQKWSGEADNNG